ncbi:MAG: hypothetical protein G01um101429_981 [Parcubacteria group bacterium Gr01-1014_29]|nr:MAG: hypothetical protein G01um101429_981 [Parcubacteria group bacterium Gr01-1014_29]
MINTHTLKGTLYVLLSSLMFGSYGVWIKLLGPEFGIFYQAWVKSALVLLVLIPVAFYTKSWKKIEKKDHKWLFISILLGICTQVPLYYSFTHAGIGISSLIFFSVFLLTSYLVGWLLVGEEMSKIKIISFIVGLIGLLLTFGLSIKKFSILALFAAAMNGVASGGEVSTTKKISDTYPSLEITIFIWFGILATHLPASLLFNEKQLMPDITASWLAMFIYAATGIIGFWAVVEGFKFVDASIGGLIGLLEIVFSIGLGVVFFKETVTLSIAAGAVLILLAVALPYLKVKVFIQNEFKS